MSKTSSKTYLVDIDKTICATENAIYSEAVPYQNMILLINNLYEAGNTIIYYTARGSTTDIDWFDLTKSQLDSWGCKYHELLMGKPYYDFQIDDKSINSLDLLNSLDNHFSHRDSFLAFSLHRQAVHNASLCKLLTTPDISSKVDNLFNDLTNALFNDSAKIILCGNGGSFTDASHFAAELVGGFLQKGLPPLSAFVLGAQTGTLTAVSNDYSYSEVFSRELRAVASPNDLLITLTTSGQSKNICCVLQTAAQMGIKSWCITSSEASTASSLCSNLLTFGNSTLPTPDVQFLTYQLLHFLAEQLELFHSSRHSKI